MTMMTIMTDIPMVMITVTIIRTTPKTNCTVIEYMTVRKWKENMDMIIHIRPMIILTIIHIPTVTITISLLAALVQEEDNLMNIMIILTAMKDPR
jgi:hypothetical protein